MSGNSFHCPSCGSADTQKSSLAYENGLSDIKTRSKSSGLFFGRGGLGLGLGRTKTKGSSQTKLSQKTAPPAKKTYFKPILFMFLGWQLLALILPNLGTVFTVIFAMGVIAWVYFARSYNTKQWPSLKSIWDKAFICLRCDNQFEMESR